MSLEGKYGKIRWKQETGNLARWPPLVMRPFVGGNGLLLERVGSKGKARVREWKQGVSKEHAISYLHKRELTEE
jgi:hypothetical protein